MNASRMPRSRRARHVLAVLSFLAVGSSISMSTPAQAEDEFDVTVSKGQVVVVAKGDWHINQEFPWKVVVGDTKLDKTKFTLTEKNATVTNVPSGQGKVKGAVCSHDSCHTLEKNIVVP
jgi:hypothetical protein